MLIFSVLLDMYYLWVSFQMSHVDSHSWPAFPLHHTWSIFLRTNQKNQPQFFPPNSLSFHSQCVFLLFRFASVPTPSLFLSFCLNLLPLMSPSRESQAWKKGRGLTEIDVWALPLIRWLNPSINMQRRCPMQMDPIRQNGVVLSARCGEW